jgi:hypothetical protein
MTLYPFHLAGIAMTIDRLIAPWAAGRMHRLGSG